MHKEFLDALEKRRSVYTLAGDSPLDKNEIREIAERALLHCPSAFHSQTGRILLLLGDEHHRLWTIVLSALERRVPAERFPRTRKKIRSFDQAHGSFVFFEEQQTLRELEEKYPKYAHNVPHWACQSTGMLQYMVWASLAQAGLGASLQHYNELIEEEVRKTWDLSETWKLISQMPFGRILEPPKEKQFLPLDIRLDIRS